MCGTVGYLLADIHVDHVSRCAHPRTADDPDLPEPLVLARKVESGHDDEGDGEDGTEDIVVDLCRREKDGERAVRERRRVDREGAVLLKVDHG